ncbi:hypothetical protein CYJ27_06365 [Aerococcus christensenii]|uniref:Uncharacterized protein n=1 Tax=Aerococcus christensenii TaxID=87541 RepID=A0A133XZA2_9LACT|nr:hypothetical protein [Aerococcus christensenii]KXB36289.1 hypothetical protein HMPREF3187_00930 [Aerococcus christensenii]MDK8234243.1 hypothetical protein [Aerococcus christensenii]PKY91069.1 hypothetical protein CYJ27_06365 [Aerococcus christensenii]
MQAIFETVFDVCYLSMVIFLGIKMIKKSKSNRQFFLYGVMAVVLGIGDAFHLLPRAVALNTTGLAYYSSALGIGKCVTSVTMTLFYLLFYYVWRERYQMRGRHVLTGMVWGISLIRILLVVLPQNEWLSAHPPLVWGIYRNIPFVLLGGCIMTLFYKSVKANKADHFKWIWLTILLSFIFYLPVVLFSEQLPPIGALMIPKTCAYVWAVWIGYKTMNKELD